MSKTVKIEAMQVTLDAAGWPSAVVTAWCGGLGLWDEKGARIEVETSEGTMAVRPGDWLFRGALLPATGRLDR